MNAQIRSLGTGAASAASRIAGIAVPLVGSALLDQPVLVSFILYGACFAAVALAAAVLPVETRGMKLRDAVGMH